MAYLTRESRYRVIRKEQHEFHMAPREDASEMITFEQICKRSDHYHQQDLADHDHHFQKPYYYQQSHVGHKGPYLHATLVHDQQQPCTYRGPFVQTRIAPQGPHVQGTITQYSQGDQNYPLANMVSNQVAPQVVMKKNGGAIDCNEAAKHYGGVVFIDYGRTNNKLPLRS
ncbi:hypothetical protein PanWU01x14_141520 [Parasponia andersonii]|uniref:Uncharacterized protein n=1 Tax=Parasponia andersonii TaxID=3476 RepID=A0A2P5CLM7_PARAD|nr:hypothetical protein PanWU01x14_141520 [Parasponia andersonii]